MSTAMVNSPNRLVTKLIFPNSLGYRYVWEFMQHVWQSMQAVALKHPKATKNIEILVVEGDENSGII